MAYSGYRGCGPRKLGTTPAKHTTKRNGDPVNAGHLSRHEKGTAHKTIGQAIGTAVNKVKETANVVKTKVKKGVKVVKDEATTIVNDFKETVKN